MARAKPWLKMWAQWIHDAKMLGLTLAETGAWWKLVTLAHECGKDGQLVKGDGTPLTSSEIANCLHITSPKDRKILEGMISKMAGLGSLHWNSNLLVVTHYSERQEFVPSESKEAIKERVRRHRENLKRRAAGLPPLVKDKEEEEEEESNGVTSVTSDPILAEISKLYEENCGMITPILQQDIVDFCENYRGPLKWVRDAFAEAVKRNKRHWKYIEAILDRWQREGRGPDKKEGNDYGTHRQGDKESSAERLRKSAE